MSCVSHGAGSELEAGPIVAVVVAVAVAPALSVTVRRTVNVPFVEYVWAADEEVATVSAAPSPQFHV
jgi:hypothetical protein